ncbi:MAG: hypothetical protein ACE5FP_01070 [Gemmatimonadota bacterium]
MDMKRLTTGAIVGGITLFVLGYLTYGMLLAGFFEANAGGATGAAREAPIFWAVGLGEVLMGALLTLAIIKTGASGWAECAKVAAVVGFLAWGAVDLIHYGVMDVMNLTAALVDPFVEIVRHGIAGAAIAMVAGGKAAAASASEY